MNRDKIGYIIRNRLSKKLEPKLSVAVPITKMNKSVIDWFCFFVNHNNLYEANLEIMLIQIKKYFIICSIFIYLICDGFYM